MLGSRHKSGGLISRSSGNPVDNRTLLNANTDFTFLGSYILADYYGFNGLDIFSFGLTHRYVDGTLRLMWIGFNGSGSLANELLQIRQGTLPGSYGSNINIVASHTSVWPDNFNGAGCWHSLWWDEENQLAWTASGVDYPTDEQGLATASMIGRTIGNTGGACSGYTGYHGLYGVQQRASMGKMGKVPTWAQSTYGFKSHITYSGGYASRMGYGVVLGPSFYAFDAPLGFTSGSSPVGIPPTIPQTSVQTLANLISGSGDVDWYSEGYENRTRERGCRVSNVRNEYGGWLSKPDLQPPGDPDGWNRWTWGDTFGGSGNWIDNNEGTRNRHGIVLVQKVVTGRAVYQFSQLTQEGIAYEIAVYDPADMYAVKQGTLDQWKIRPKSIAVIPVSDITSDASLSTNGEPMFGATFDATTNRLYIMIGNQNGKAKILVYQVAT